jgi:hypothetical protein
MPENVDRRDAERANKVGRVSAIASIVSGVSPLEPATPALSNKITGRLAANPSVTAASQWSIPAR